MAENWNFLKLLLFMCFLIIILDCGSLSTTNQTAPQSHETTYHAADYLVHEPIVIANDTAFETQGWPGSGTFEEPFIIEYLNIDRDSTPGSCIEISDTRAFFIIRHSEFGNATTTNAAGLFLHNVTNGQLVNNTCSNNYEGITLQESFNIIITDNLCILNYKNGIELESNSYANTVRNNTCLYNGHAGVGTWNSDDNTIANNTLNDNIWHGIYMKWSDSNYLTNNTCLSNDRDGIAMEVDCNGHMITNNICNDNGRRGIDLYSESNSILISNNTCISNDAEGIYLSGQDNTIINNTCSNNYWGMWLRSTSSNNDIEWNIFDGNTYSVLNDHSSNRFDYNYYSDYSGYDVNGDGLGDTPYTTDGLPGEVDNHPLMRPFGFPIIWQEIPGDQSVEFGTVVNITLHAAASLPGIGTWWLNDTTRFSISSSMVTNETTLLTGVYGVQVWANDTRGNTITAEFVVEVFLGLPRWVEQPTDQILEYSVPFEYELHAYSYIGLDSWWINDTTHFVIDGDGVVTNITELAVDTYGLEVSVNDTLNNILTANLSLTILPKVPPIWVEEPTDQIVEFSTSFLYDLDASDTSGLDAWWINNTLNFAIDEEGIITNTISLAISVYGLQVWVNDTLGQILTAQFNVVVEDTTPPSWTDPPANRYMVFDTSFRYDLNATDPSGIDKWWLGNETLFSIDENGIITNVTILAIGQYSVEVYVNDTKGNVLMTSFEVEVRYRMNIPIIIESDDDFMRLGWPGSGTEDYPFRIENLILDLQEFSQDCITIRNTRAYFIIRNCTLRSSDYINSIFLNNVTNGIIQNCTCFGGGLGMYLVDVGNIAIRDSNCINIYDMGIFLEIAIECRLENNWFNASWGGIVLYRTDNCTVLNNQMIETGVGIYLVEANYNFVSGNQIIDSLEVGVAFEFANYNVLTNNTISDSEFEGFLLYLSSNNEILWNIFENNNPNAIVEYGRDNILDYNYWSDYSGTDANNDGIGDSAYLIYGGGGLDVSGIDSHPLMYNPSPPTWIEIPSGCTVDYNEEIRLNATGSGPFTWSLNVSSYLAIDANGTITITSILPLGTYHLQVVVANIYGRNSSASFSVTVVDLTAPYWVVDPTNQVSEYGDNFIYSIDAYDDYGIHTWWINHTDLFYVDNEGDITNITDLALGVYSLEIRVQDNYGNFIFVIIEITVVDSTPPTISHPDDITYAEGETGNTMTWYPSDLLPESYEILLDGVEIRSGMWNSSSESISVSVDGLAIGNYVYVINVNDSSGNTVSDYVIVVVQQAMTFPTTSTTTSTTTVTTSTPTTTPTSTTTTTTTPTPPDNTTLLIIMSVLGVGGLTIIIIIVVVIKRRTGG